MTGLFKLLRACIPWSLGLLYISHEIQGNQEAFGDVDMESMIKYDRDYC